MRITRATSTIQETEYSFLVRVGANDDVLVRGRQTHGTNVALVSKVPGQRIPDTDALVTNVPGIFLGVVTADCAPVFFWYEAGDFVGIAHVGWRGCRAGLTSAVVRTVQRAYAVAASEVHIHIGPCIRTCHHVADSEHPDLPKTIREQMIAGGVLPENISDCGECTYCRADMYFSHRRDRDAGLARARGNMLSVIGFHS